MSFEVGCSGKEVSHPFEHKVKIPEDSGVGEIREIRLFSGISLFVSNCRYYKDRSSELDETRPCLGFGFCLSGLTRINQDCMKKEFFVRGNESAFYHFPDMRGAYLIKSNNDILTIGIQMNPDFFYSLMEEERHYESPLLRKFVDNEFRDSFRDTNIVSPPMKRVMWDIFNCEEKGLSRRFFYESRVMELMFLKIKQLESGQSRVEKPFMMHSGDIKKIIEAGEILAKNLENPPGLVELSRSVGLSRTQLLKYFSDVFGFSPYKYLRNLRLEKAVILLRDGKVNITEIAFKVGYSSSSHFTKVFKDYYGMPPSKYIRKLHF